MRTRTRVVLALAAVVCLAGWRGYAQTQERPTVKWEYRMVQMPVSQFLNEAYLNPLGNQGWELVSVTFGCLGDHACYTTAYLKRAK